MKSKFNNRAPEIEAGSTSHFTNPSIWPSTNLMEAAWDTLFALAMAAAICLVVANLAAHLNEVQAARNAGIETSKQVGLMSSGRFSPGVSQTGDQQTSQFD